MGAGQVQGADAAAAAAAQNNNTTNGSTQAGQPNAAAQPWYHDFSDPDLRGYVENKKWASPMEAAKSAREAEKLIGVPKEQLLRLPKPDAKPEEWNPVYDRLGRPAKPEDYKLPTVEGGENFAKAMAPMLHSAGLSQTQVDKIANGWNSYIEQAVKAQETEQQQREQVDLQELHREWPGQTFSQREALAQRAFREFAPKFLKEGEDPGEVLSTMEDAMGTARFLRFWSAVGESMGEAKYVDDGASNRTFGMTPEAAKAKQQELMADPEFVKKAMNKNSAEAQQLDRLARIQAGV